MTDEDRDQIVQAATDILVTGDILDDIVREADSHTIEQAVVIHDAIGQVIAKAKKAQAALETHLNDVMELRSTVEYRGHLYTKVPKTETERFDHDEIIRYIRRRALDAMTGDTETPPLPPMAALSDALRELADIYLSASTKAKIQQLERYQIPCVTNADNSVRTKTYAGNEIKVIPLAKGDQ